MKVCCVLGSACPILCGPMNYCPPGSSVHGISQARILEWVAISYSRRSFWPRDRTQDSCISCTGTRILYHYHHLGSDHEREPPIQYLCQQPFFFTLWRLWPYTPSSQVHSKLNNLFLHEKNKILNTTHFCFLFTASYHVWLPSFPSDFLKSF